MCRINAPGVRTEVFLSVFQYNNMQEKDRIARKGAMLQDGYITSNL